MKIRHLYCMKILANPQYQNVMMYRFSSQGKIGLLVKSAPFSVKSAPFFLAQKLSILHLFCQICTFFLFHVKRIFCCKICLYWVRLGLGSPQGLEKPPARARKAPCKGQDSNLSYFMVKKGAELTTFGWKKRCRFDKKRCKFDNFLSDTKKVQI